jgi:hypothetical protein
MALSEHSQVELEAVESYERSHKDRGPVLAKLHYMRGREPSRATTLSASRRSPPR